jgi:hypothetical protein
VLSTQTFNHCRGGIVWRLPLTKQCCLEFCAHCCSITEGKCRTGLGEGTEECPLPRSRGTSCFKRQSMGGRTTHTLIMSASPVG